MKTVRTWRPLECAPGISVEVRKGVVIRALDERGAEPKVWVSQPWLWGRHYWLEITEVVAGEVRVRSVEP